MVPMCILKKFGGQVEQDNIQYVIDITRFI